MKAIEIAIVVLLQTGFSLASQLLLVQAVWRHGDRTPTSIYKNDPYQESFWPVPLGQLTNKGMDQLFKNGEKFRVRYVDQLSFLSSNYSVKEVRVRSTDVDRALVSALSHFAGLYSVSQGTHPQDSPKWPAGWTPIPIHTVQFETDNLLNDNAKCAKANVLVGSLYVLEGFQQFMKSKKAFLEMLTEKMGQPVNDIKTVAYAYDAMNVERLYNLPQPEWATDEVFNELEEIYERGTDYFRGLGTFNTSEASEILKLKGGELMRTMLTNMDEAIEGKQSTKYFAFSAHDTTMATFLGVLGAKLPILGHKVPEYASTIIVELWKDDEGNHQVSVLYMDNSESPFRVITPLVSGCPNAAFCPLNTFIARSKSYVTTDITEECKIASGKVVGSKRMQ